MVSLPTEFFVACSPKQLVDISDSNAEVATAQAKVCLEARSSGWWVDGLKSFLDVAGIWSNPEIESNPGI